MLVDARTGIRREDRRVRLLDLEEQRVVLGVAHEEDHERLGPDRSDADDLPREVLEVVVVEHETPVRIHGLGVVEQALADELLGGLGRVLRRAHDHRRLLPDAIAAAVHALGEFLERPEARAPAGLREVLLRLLQRRLPLDRAEPRQHLLHVDPGVPDVEEAHRRRVGHRRAIGLRGGARGRTLVLPPVAVVARRDDEARDEALDVPLERRGERLVEVVEVEDEPAVRRGEHPEVREVRVAAALHAQAGGRGLCEVARHDRGAAPVERERRDDHPPVADRDEVRHARLVLSLEDADGVGAVGRRVPDGVRLERHLLALGAPLRHAVLDRLREVEHAARCAGGLLRGLLLGGLLRSLGHGWTLSALDGWVGQVIDGHPPPQLGAETPECLHHRDGAARGARHALGVGGARGRGRRPGHVPVVLPDRVPPLRHVRITAPMPPMRIVPKG